MHRDMVVSYVRDLLEQITGTRPQFDADGDLPVTYRGADFYVRVIGDDPVVQVFCVALAEIEPTPELLAALNDANASVRFARTFHVGSQVLVEHEIWGSDINPANFEYACRTVATAADSFGSQLVQDFGGVARFERSKTTEYQPLEAGTGGMGLYL